MKSATIAQRSATRRTLAIRPMGGLFSHDAAVLHRFSGVWIRDLLGGLHPILPHHRAVYAVVAALAFRHLNRAVAELRKIGACGGELVGIRNAGAVRPEIA